MLWRLDLGQWRTVKGQLDDIAVPKLQTGQSQLGTANRQISKRCGVIGSRSQLSRRRDVLGFVRARYETCGFCVLEPVRWDW